MADRARTVTEARGVNPDVRAEAAALDRPLMYRLSKAAEVTGLSQDFLRRVPDLPKVVIRGAGAKDRRPVVGILYDDLVAWLQRQRQG
ncbi:MAG TPA: hypothetical protein VGR09_12260 [Gemmatimonadales bacterium]|nr:hypothetical protein [Gemmatimonadales bacterium]